MLSRMSRRGWSRTLPWVALVLLALLAWENLRDNPYGLPLWLFAVPVVLAVVSLVLAVRAERIVDIVVSGLVIVAIPVWVAATIVLLHFVSLRGSDFSP